MEEEIQSITKEELKQVIDETKTERPDDRLLNVGKTYFDRYKSRGFTENLVEVFHENTKQSNMHNRFVGLESVRRFNQQDVYDYVISRTPDRAQNRSIPLPKPELPERSLEDVLQGRRSRRQLSGEPLSLDELSALLHYSLGVNGKFTVELELPNGDSPELTHRPYPSAGALYPVESYLLVFNVEGLVPGIYYYKAEDHVLRVIEEDPDLPETVPDTFVDLENLDPRNSAVTFVFTAMFWASMAKYGPRGYRFILHEAGHMSQNLLLTSEALDLGATAACSFSEHDLDDYLGIDGVNETALYATVIGNLGDPR